MPHQESVHEVASRVRAGSVRAIARGLSWIESGGEMAEALTDCLYPFSGKAHVVGITGAPGSGKSTLTAALTRVIRASGVSVGIVAIDPSSPFSGGSILGDRIRMSEIGNDTGVFIRSMATRGALGGLCAAARDAVDLLDASGKGVVIVETVGVGQDEFEIMRLAHTILVVSVPGLGDDIQAMKAGTLEIADIHVVNKADREGAQGTAAEIRAALTLGAPSLGWEPPVLLCAATSGSGVDAVHQQITAHESHLKTTREWEARERRMAETRVLRLAQQLVTDSLRQPTEADRRSVSDALIKVATRELSPLRCARTLLSQVSARERTAHVRP
jgi:LAO/AO transport system kinase